MQKYSLRLVFICTFFYFSCSEQIIGPDPANDPRSNFNLLWKDFDIHYARFIYKNVNWDSLYSAYYPRLHENTTNNELFDVLSSLLGNLKDSHSVLESPFKFYKYFLVNYIENFNFSNVKTHYLQGIKTKKFFTYGQIMPDVGYIHILTFSNNEQDYFFIDNILEELNKNKGIIIDVRNNGGGSNKNAEVVASRFTDSKRLYLKVKYRNGPSHNNFYDLVDIYINPGGSSQFLGNTIVLTNRYVGSAAEDFILMMGVLPHVTVVGDTTSGSCGGDPITRELPNGWLYRIPTSMQLTTENKAFEGIGIEPDIPLWISRADEMQGRDTFIEKAIELLK